ncbi:MAG: hypothetical protein HZA48_00125 [Planctomycetes bacterium]|nr:hypothetical protein [Planctomycetota bacterium]
MTATIKIILVLSLCALAGQTALPQSDSGLDLAKWQDMLDAHKRFYLGKKKPAPDLYAVKKDGTMAITPYKDKLSWYWSEVRESFGAFDAPAADSSALKKKLAELTKEFDKHATEIENLQKAVSDCASQLTAARTSLALDSEKPMPLTDKSLKEKVDAFKNTGIEKYAGNTDEIFFLLNQFIKNIKSKKRDETILWCAELNGALSRLKRLDLWMLLQTKWMIESTKLGLDTLAAIPGWNGKGRELPGGYALMYRYEDIAEIQRQIEDLFIIDSSEKTATGTPETVKPVFFVAPKNRKFYKELASGLKDEKEILLLLNKSIENDYDNAYLNHLIWKYDGEKSTDRLIEVIKKWKELHKDDMVSETARLGLLEVMNYRQGSIETAPKASDRFHAKITETLPKITGTKGEQFYKAHSIVLKWNEEFTYGGTNSIEETFSKLTADCYRVSNLAGCLMANNGNDGIYPIRSLNNHVLLCCRIDNAYVARDPLSSLGWTLFPGGFTTLNAGDWMKDRDEKALGGGDAIISTVDIMTTPGLRMDRWCRTIATWIDADILLGDAPPRLYHREIPYYK